MAILCILLSVSPLFISQLSSFRYKVTCFNYTSGGRPLLLIKDGCRTKKLFLWKTGIPSFFLHAYTVSIVSLSSETFLWMFTLLLISSFMILSSLDILQLLLTKIHFNSFQSLSIPLCCFLCLNPVKQYTLDSCLMYLMFCNFICP